MSKPKGWNEEDGADPVCPLSLLLNCVSFYLSPSKLSTARAVDFFRGCLSVCQRVFLAWPALLMFYKWP